MSQLIGYLRKNLRYPEAASKANVEGRVIVTFIVGEQGTIQNVQVLRPVHPALDAEAVRFVQSMPNWIPAKQGGKAVAYRYNLPVPFSLKSFLYILHTVLFLFTRWGWSNNVLLRTVNFAPPSQTTAR